MSDQNTDPKHKHHSKNIKNKEGVEPISEIFFGDPEQVRTYTVVHPTLHSLFVPKGDSIVHPVWIITGKEEKNFLEFKGPRGSEENSPIQCVYSRKEIFRYSFMYI